MSFLMDGSDDTYRGTQLGATGAGFTNSPGMNDRRHGYTQSSQITPRKGGPADQNTATSMLAVTCKQMELADPPAAESNWQIDGRPVHFVRIMGCVMNIDEKSTHTRITIEDGTGEGMIEVWQAGSQDERRKSQMPVVARLKVHQYVEATGRLNHFKDIKAVNAYSLRIVEELNEFVCHQLSALHASLALKTHAKKMAAGGGHSSSSTRMASFGGTNTGTRMSGMAAAGGGGGRGAGGSHSTTTMAMGMDIDGNDDDLSPLEKRIMRILERPECMESEQGAHIDDLFKNIHDVDPNDIKESVQRLITEGNLYTTTDEEHFKSAGGF